ncbi:sugar phosphotransferase [Peterkaempfera bronchialis]|uniref:Sugar phosphotransferase n=1 Tax=Peterkaempfera bronchialis TaxID=2126346 RepID=A0A345SWL4_9ACTN|nr:sugar phosphotransferase [Peterkaempfera bronchialis]
MEENVTDAHGALPDLVIPERCELTFDLHPVTGYVHSGLTPLQAREENFAAVTGALDDAGVDWFAVRGFEDLATAVGVHGDDRERVFAALADLCARRPGYIQGVVPAPRTPRGPARGDDPKTWEKLAEAQVVRAVWYRTEPTRSLICGPRYGCDIEFWWPEERPDADADGDGDGGADQALVEALAEAPERLAAPRANRVARLIPAESETVEAPGNLFTRIAPQTATALRPVRTRPEFTVPLFDDFDFPVDVVYTWVDGNDPAWQRRRADASGEVYHAESASHSRFTNRDELRYSLRSLHLNAPWVRTIHLVTDDQVPDWLDTSVPGLKVVSHKEIFSDPSVLPTFNSHAIESQLHHIEGLAEHFLYFNDDMFIGRPVGPQLFFLTNGTARYFPARGRVPQGEVSPLDTPVDVATKNNRRVFQERFGRSITQVMEHAPYAMRRSVLDDLEREYPEVFRTTAANRFRSLSDHNIPSNLVHYYGYLTGRAIPSSNRFAYVALAAKDLPGRLARLLERRDRDTFCINDTFVEDDDPEGQNELLASFLEAYFPVAGPYEKAPVGGA